MLFRKPFPTSSLYSLPSTNTNTISQTLSKSKHNLIHYSTFTLFSFLFLISWLLILFFYLPTTTTTTITTVTDTPKAATCDGSGPVYIYNLHQRFNIGLLKNCENLNIYTNMCPHVVNNGLGQPISTTTTTTSATTATPSWFATHQFIAEMIIHARLENHPCRTWDPSRALIFYVPFYGGLYSSSVFGETNHTLRDSLAVDLVEFLESQEWWKRNNGEDHFVALGRTAWDFMRTKEGPDFGANVLLNMPHVLNMSVLTVERNPWKGSNQIGVPYPSYFHPTMLIQMVAWQKRIREFERPHLFSFVGGKRKGLEKAKVRDEIVKQCSESSECMLLQCGSGGSKCHEPMVVIEVMKNSRFCLQAPGDSFTRRSTFDSILAGCIPVFFSPHTAYTQYSWYLPQDTHTYSVFIHEKDACGKNKIEQVLLNISNEEVKRMREVVINLIPRITYVHPNASDVGFKDVVDVALQRLSHLVGAKVKRFGSV
ncbi:hypothetical protein TanjilG_22463 [Lupinus angustifolius]|uniref:Exostosin GT47 domain-containing protein n=1 Tax=Lupinus angustifolius TaxID=3871 RepID=A0A4P1RST0_LUPAN|nr:PREDICTED: probable xyloglucan galactosyltransferase GT17 [Lupinus angustifolius]OIW17351.1 hypothetical protein TanjilG_22463 [Lupinus angustifolius]